MAEAALARVEDLALRLGTAENLLEKGYAQFAQALLDVQKNRYWQNDFPSWGAYFAHVCEKFKLGSRQLYHKVATVKELDGVVQLSDLTDMGITKASVLAAIHRGTGTLPEGIVEQAKNPDTTAKELKRALAEATHTTDLPDDEWLDLEYAFFVSPEEREEIREAEKIARSIDPPISNSIKDFMQKKEILIRFVREFLATYAAPQDEDELFIANAESEEDVDSQENS